MDAMAGGEAERFDRDGLGDDDDFDEAHDINVTPFIDVMLVLLIIFMVAAPLSTVDLPVDLPSSTAIPQKKPDKPLYVTIKPDLAVAIGETLVKRVDLMRTLDCHRRAGQGSPHFPACRPRRALWRTDGRAGNPAHGGLSKDRVGGTRGRSRGSCGNCRSEAVNVGMTEVLHRRVGKNLLKHLPSLGRRDFSS